MQLLDTTDRTDANVSLEVCEACCRTFEPTVRDWNPVIASLVWSAADQRRSAPQGSEDQARWERLRTQAEASFPPVLPEEDDLPLRPNGFTTAGDCRTVQDIARVLPFPAVRSGQVTRWAVGVTTAPRRVSTLMPCVQSLLSVGFADIHLFIDGDVDIPEMFHDLPRSQQIPALGVRQSYYRALVKLLEAYPDADTLLLVQDDAWWPPHLPVREYLESCLWPGSQPGLVSAWCSSDDTQPSAGWFATQRPWRFGAVAFIYPREFAERFIHDPLIQQACAVPPGTRSGGLSMLIGDWAARSQIPIVFPTPSLVQHLGDVSTIYESSRAVGVRYASRFLGDEMPA